MISSLKLLSLAALSAVLITGLAQVSQAQGALKGNFNDWELRCEQPQGKDEQCILYQNVADENDSNINVVVVVLRIAEGGTDGKPVIRKPVLRVIANFRQHIPVPNPVRKAARGPTWPKLRWTRPFWLGTWWLRILPDRMPRPST